MLACIRSLNIGLRCLNRAVDTARPLRGNLCDACIASTRYLPLAHAPLLARRTARILPALSPHVPRSLALLTWCRCMARYFIIHFFWTYRWACY